MIWPRASARSSDLEARERALQPDGRRWEGPLRERLGGHLERTGTSQTTGCPRHPFPSWNSAPLPRPKQRQSQPFPNSLKGEQGVKLSVSHRGKLRLGKSQSPRVPEQRRSRVRSEPHGAQLSAGHGTPTLLTGFPHSFLQVNTWVVRRFFRQ